jgi:hypothetical protein
MTPLEAALLYASYGWHTFPCCTARQKGCGSHGEECGHPGKAPRTLNGVLDATADLAKLQYWWEMWPDANVAIAAGPSGLSILDVDQKHGGLETLTGLEAKHGKLPITPLVLTGGGGGHFYYAAVPGLGPKVGFLPGLDIRSSTSYVIAPPSLHQSGKLYQWAPEQSHDIVPNVWPEWLVVPKKTASTGTGTGESIPSGMRNARIFEVACALRRKGLGYGAILAGISEHNQAACSPPLLNDEIQGIALRASKYPPGDWTQHHYRLCDEDARAHSLVLLPVVVAAEGVAQETEKPKTFPIYVFGNPEKEREVPIPAPLIPDILFPGLTVLCGKWKRAKKTQYALQMSYCLQAGIPFFGRPVAPLRVMWIQRDMPEGLFLEYTRCLREGLGLPPTEILYIAEPMNLMEEEDRSALVHTFEEHRPNVLVVDSTRGVSDIDENDSKEVAAFLRGFLNDRIRDPLKIHIILISHPSKNASSTRGSGDWGAAPDSIQDFEPHYQPGENHPDYIVISGHGRHPDFTISFAVDYLPKSEGGWVMREITEEEKQQPENESQLAKFEKAAPGIDGWHSLTQWGIKCRIGTSDRKMVVEHFFGRGLLESNRAGFPNVKYRWVRTTGPSVDGAPDAAVDAGLRSEGSSIALRSTRSTDIALNTGTTPGAVRSAPGALPESPKSHFDDDELPFDPRTDF